VQDTEAAAEQREELALAANSVISALAAALRGLDGQSGGVSSLNRGGEAPTRSALSGESITDIVAALHSQTEAACVALGNAAKAQQAMREEIQQASKQLNQHRADVQQLQSERDALTRDHASSMPQQEAQRLQDAVNCQAAELGRLNGEMASIHAAMRRAVAACAGMAAALSGQQSPDSTAVAEALTAYDKATGAASHGGSIDAHANTVLGSAGAAALESQLAALAQVLQGTGSQLSAARSEQQRLRKLLAVQAQDAESASEQREELAMAASSTISALAAALLGTAGHPGAVGLSRTPDGSEPRFSPTGEPTADIVAALQRQTDAACSALGTVAAVQGEAKRLGQELGQQAAVVQALQAERDKLAHSTAAAAAALAAVVSCRGGSTPTAGPPLSSPAQTLDSHVAAVTALLDRADQRQAALQSQTQLMQKEYDSQAFTLAELQAESSGFRREISAAVTAILAAATRHEHLSKGELAALMQHTAAAGTAGTEKVATTLSIQVSAIIRLLDALAQAYVTLREQAHGLKQVAKQQQEMVQQAYAEKDTAQQYAMALQTELQASRTALSSASASQAAGQAQAADIQRLLTEAEGRQQSLRAEMQQQQLTLAEQTASAEKLQAECAQLRRDAGAALAVIASAISRRRNAGTPQNEHMVESSAGQHVMATLESQALVVAGLLDQAGASESELKATVLRLQTAQRAGQANVLEPLPGGQGCSVGTAHSSHVAAVSSLLSEAAQREADLRYEVQRLQRTIATQSAALEKAQRSERDTTLEAQAPAATQGPQLVGTRSAVAGNTFAMEASSQELQGLLQQKQQEVEVLQGRVSVRDETIAELESLLAALTADVRTFEGVVTRVEAATTRLKQQGKS
jgi:chromosome segregation ATPase